MYLYAERRFPDTSPEADQIIAAAATFQGAWEAEPVSLDYLKRLSKADPREAETEVYLSRWRHQIEPFHGRAADPKRVAEYERATAVFEAAGLLPFATDDAGGGALGWEDGELYVRITAVYWRKANAIHDWFVERVQAGVDDCGTYEVAGEALAHLRSLCMDALTAYEEGDRARAGEILAPRPGFFFGSAEVDEWWEHNARRTVVELERVIGLAVTGGGGVTFRYDSSW